MNNDIFASIKPYLDQSELADLNVIVKKIANEDEDIFTDISKEVWKIIDSKMHRILIKEGINIPAYDRSSKLMFDMLSKRYAYLKQLENLNQKNAQIPRLIYATFNYVRNWRNYDSHPDEFQIKRSYNDIVHLLKSFSVLVTFFINFFEDEQFINTSFDENELLKSMNLRKHFIDEIVDTNKQLDTSSIKLGKIPLSSFVLNNEINFFIPSYQRKYRWDDETCGELVSGIIDKLHDIDDEYFGTMAITIEHGTRNSSIRTIRLIDGQQRVTTSLIIFRVIFDLWKEKNLHSQEDEISEIPDELQSTFTSVDPTIAKYKNVTGDKVENDAIEYIINSQEPLENRKKNIWRFETIGKSRAATNYNLIYSRLDNLSQDELGLFYNRFGYQFLISCVDFNKTPAEEMEIFESLNSKGTELESFDMIKNFLFNLVDKDIFLAKENEVIKIYNKYLDFSDWKMNNEKTIKHQEAFLYSFCEYKLFSLNLSDKGLNKNKKSILKNFKEIYYNKEKINLAEFEKIVSDIGKYVCIAKSFHTKRYDKNSQDILYPIRYNLANIAHKDISLLILFFFVDIYGKNKWDSYSKTLDLSEKVELFKQTLFEFEKWIISMLQVSGTGQSLAKTILRLFKFLSFYDLNNHAIQKQLPSIIASWLSMNINEAFIFQHDDQKKYLLENLDYKRPTKEQFYNALINNKVQDRNVAMVLLKRLESYFSHDWEIMRDKSSLEHIMPKKFEKTTWLDSLKAENSTLSNAEIIDKHSVLLDKIGNYMILDKNKENSKLSNHSFELKQEQIISWNNPLSNLVFGKDLSKKIINISSFGFNEIEERSKAMAEIIVNQIY